MINIAEMAPAAVGDNVADKVTDIMFDYLPDPYQSEILYGRVLCYMAAVTDPWDLFTRILVDLRDHLGMSTEVFDELILAPLQTAGVRDLPVEEYA